MLGVVVESTDNVLRPVVRLFYDTRHDWAVSRKDIDISKPNGKGDGDRIIGYESAKRRRINPLKILGITGSPGGNTDLPPLRFTDFPPYISQSRGGRVPETRTRAP